MKKSNELFNKIKLSVFNNINYQVFILFGIIACISIFSDFYFQNNYLTIPFIITTLASSLITYISIPLLKKIEIKQIIRKEGPKKHYLKQGTPTMGGLFFIPIGIIISNILSFKNQDYKIILTLSLLIISFMFIGLIDDLMSLKKKFNTGLTSNQKLILQFFISLVFIIICASNNFICYVNIMSDKIV